ncbi:MAG: winged helix-turn-helix domain-containing protein [Methanimicrococcus sp.]|nr:winged helix-turn-helix domain-containing protein [Methanimicrococcus sp.]
MNSFIETVFFSEKRKSVLILLFEKGPMTIEMIRSKLNETSVSILPQIKILIDQKLIIQNGGIYQLTRLGEVIVEKTGPFIKNLQVFEKNTAFWNEHDISEIPEKLIKKIRDIGDFEVVKLDLHSVNYKPSPIINENIQNAESIKTLITYYTPEYVPVYYDCVMKDIPVTIITNENILNKANDYKSEINQILKQKNAELYILPEEIRIAGVTVTDKVLFLVLYSVTGNLDYEFLTSKTPSAIQWGNELFEYLKNLSQRKMFI